MTVLVGGLMAATALAFATFLGDLGAAATARTRAQLAADAAALAAIAENVPGSRGLTTNLARRFAARNGAELVTCVCEPGATSVELEVEVDGVRARSRAVIDVTRLMPVTGSASSSGLDGRLAGALHELLATTGGRVRLVSGWRSTERQAALWSQALQRYGTPERADDWVARPGSSMHERGLAVDLGGDLDLAMQRIRELGLPMYRPLANEPWHFELLGSRS